MGIKTCERCESQWETEDPEQSCPQCGYLDGIGVTPVKLENDICFKLSALGDYLAEQGEDEASQLVFDAMSEIERLRGANQQEAGDGGQA